MAKETEIGMEKEIKIEKKPLVVELFNKILGALFAQQDPKTPPRK